MQSLEETLNRCSDPLRSHILREKGAVVHSSIAISPSCLGKVSVAWYNLSSCTRKLFRKFCVQPLLLHYCSFIISSGCASRKLLYGNWLLRTNSFESQRKLRSVVPSLLTKLHGGKGLWSIQDTDSNRIFSCLRSDRDRKHLLMSVSHLQVLCFLIAAKLSVIICPFSTSSAFSAFPLHTSASASDVYDTSPCCPSPDQPRSTNKCLFQRAPIPTVQLGLGSSNRFRAR